MTSGKPRRDSEAAFDDIVDLGSIPPPPGVVGPDVHAARTAVAAMPKSLLEELRRAKHNDGGAEANRTRKQEKFELPSLAKRGQSFTNEAPTAPGRDGMRLLRPLAPDVDDLPPPSPREDLVSAVTEAIATANHEELRALETLPAPPAPTPVAVPEPPVAIVKTPPMPVPAPVIAQPVTTPAAMEAPAIALMAEQNPAAVPVIDGSPLPEEARPAVRVQFLVALMIAVGAALVLAMMAIADRVFIHR